MDNQQDTTSSAVTLVIYTTTIANNNSSNTKNRLQKCEVKVDSHTACRAAKGLDCVFPHLIYTVRPCLIHTCHAMPMPMPCSDHAVLLKATAQNVRRETPCGLPACVRLLPATRGVPRRLLSEAYKSQIQMASVKPNNVCYGQEKQW